MKPVFGGILTAGLLMGGLVAMIAHDSSVIPLCMFIAGVGALGYTLPRR